MIWKFKIWKFKIGKFKIRKLNSRFGKSRFGSSRFRDSIFWLRNITNLGLENSRFGLPNIENIKIWLVEY